MFSSTVMDHFLNPRNVGLLPEPHRVGLAGSMREGRFMQLSLHVEDGKIEAASFKTYGCVPAIAAASCLTEWLQGLTVEEALSITPDQLVERLGGLPPRRTFCATMAIAALREALVEVPSCS